MFRRLNLLLNLKEVKRKKTYVFFLALLYISSQIIYGQISDKTQEITQLEPGSSIEREIARGEKHVYKIVLAERQFANVSVEQKGIDVVIRVFNKTDERAMAQKDLNAKNEGREEIGFMASSAGEFRLEIEAKWSTSPTGRYAVLLAEVRPPTEKEIRLEEARKLHNESFNLWRSGKYAEAIPVSERSLEIREQELGETDLDVASSLANLSMIVSESGNYEKGAAINERALTIREKILGPEHLDVSYSLNNLGVAYRVLGEYAKAEQYLKRALEIREKTLAPDSPNIAFSLSGLASVYLDKGDRDKALELILRALSIWEKSSGPEHPNTALGLQLVATVYTEKGDYESAEPYALRALGILQKVFGANHPRIANSLGDLAILYSKKGDYAKAESLFQQTLAIMEKTIGKEHRNYALALCRLAVLYTDIGDYEKAEPLYIQAIENTEKIFGSQHPYVILYLEEQARNYQAKGDTAKSLKILMRARELQQQNLQLILSINSERQKLSFLRIRFGETNQFISAHLRFAPDDPAALELALTTILERKGIVSDAMASDFADLRNRFNKDDQILLDKLKEINTLLARKILDESPNVAPEEYQKQLKVLEEQKEKLESEISRRSAEFRSQIQPVTISSVRSQIPEDAALIEFGIYYPYDPKVIDSKAYGEPRYVAYVIRRTGKIQWKDLGATQEINSAIETFRESLSDPNRKDVKQNARRIDEKTMGQIRGLTGDAKKFLISPDGELNLIPFEALVDEKNKYLIENYSFTYFTSGRDLLRVQVPRESKNKFLIIANPTFGEPTEARFSKINSARKNKGQSVTAARDLSDTYFTPLGGTAQEARSIQSIFPQATFLNGAEATETALKQAVAPRILHIATHGFFLEDSEITFNGDAGTDKRSSSVKNTIENPLLRSGLALAGANRYSEAKEDGILTALEASGLNLWGTKLVVLSACDTGLGEVKNGEGVYGLRRAFVLAGTESLVMSLWSVSDYVTRELMTNYYKNLKRGDGRGAALRQVQLEMLKQKGREHPFYWAGFIQSGEWANLDGKR